MGIMIDIFDLMAKPKLYTFTQEERDIIKSHIKSTAISVFYCIQRNPMVKNSRSSFALVFDYMHNSERGKTIKNNMEVICYRQMSDLELEDLITEFGMDDGRRFRRWKYDSLEKLINDDRNCGVETPQEVIEMANKRPDIISITEKKVDKKEVSLFKKDNIVHFNNGTKANPESNCHDPGAMSNDAGEITCFKCLELMKANNKTLLLF